MRDLFVTWCTEAGCTISVDRVGNIFARRPGRDDHLPPVLMGSHLDTQVAGGKYDGIVGVLAGLEVLRTLDDAARGARKRPLELVCWTNEEGARFTPPMVASGAFAGVFDVDWVLALRDDDGNVFGGELERIGYDGKSRGGRPRHRRLLRAAHRAGARSSTARRCPSASWWAATRARGMHVDVHGETAHAGPTPMDRRRNALVGAAMLAVAVNEVGWKYHATEGKATVAAPGGLAQQGRHPLRVRAAHLRRAPRRARGGRPDVGRGESGDAGVRAARQRRDARRRASGSFGSERFDPGCIRLIREAAGAPGRPAPRHPEPGRPRRLLHLAIAPTAMIFTPCRDGISHNEAEHAELDYTVPGVNVLLHAVLARANR